jgi:hypothetical protein
MMSRIGVLALLLSLFLAAGRTVLAARNSLGIAGGNGVLVGARSGDPTLEASLALDSLLASCAIGAGRDPFRPGTPPPPIGGGRIVRPAVVEPEVTPPRVAVYMQDGNSTIIQLEVDGATSPRLGKAGSFRGWTITGIAGRKVTVAKDGTSYDINRP